MSSKPDPDMPCGRCDVGTYCYEAAYNPAADAIADGGDLPRCKSHDRECVGAQHFKAALPRPPMDEAMV